MQEHVKALINGEHGEVEAIVELHEFLGARGEGRVNLRHIAVVQLPLFRLRHELQHALHAPVPVLRVGCNLEPVDRLQQLRLLVQQLRQRLQTLNLGQPAALDALGFVLPPVL